MHSVILFESSEFFKDSILYNPTAQFSGKLKTVYFNSNIFGFKHWTLTPPYVSISKLLL